MPIFADTKNEVIKNKETSSVVNELQKSIKDLQQRLSSVEQPIWQIGRGDDDGWAHCGQGNVCRCMIGTKSLNCWNHRLKTVPIGQIIPVNIFNM